MKLLHAEVDITPGRAGTKQAMSPVQEGAPLPGSAVVRLTNTTSQNNAYTVRLRCESNSFWQESWYRLIPLPPAPGDKNSVPAGKRDEPGPQATTLKLYILSGGSREILIQFNVPKSPEARAGRYRYEIEIETQVLNAPSETARRDSRVVKLPGAALVRPFYNWSCELKKTVSDAHPEEPQHVKRLRPTANLELFVTNEGNDWLYCDVLLPQGNDLDLECFSRRVAVRPAEIGELLPASDTGGESRPGTQRHVPIDAHSRVKTLRGEPTTQPIPINLQRVDAPSVAPTPEDEFFAGTGKVICKPTSEKIPPPGDRAIVYYPPVPATFTEFFRGLFSSGRTLVMAAVGLIVVGHIAILMYQQIAFRAMKVNVVGGDHFLPGQTMVVDGKYLKDAAFSIGAKDDYADITTFKPLKDKNQFALTLPPDKRLDGKTVNIKAQRQIPLLPYLTPLLPKTRSRDFEYGTAVAQVAPKPDPLEKKLAAGSRRFEITGSDLGKPGWVFVNSQRVATSGWTDSKIIVMIPELKPGDPIGVDVQPDNWPSRIPVGSIQIMGGPVVVDKHDGQDSGGDQKARDKQARDKAAAAQAAAEKAAADKALTDKAAAGDKAAADKLAADKAAEKAAADKAAVKIAADKELAEKAAAAERAAAEKRAADKLAEDKLAAKKLAAERMRLAQVPALELLNQAYDPAAVDRTEQAAKNEIDRLEAVPDGPNKDYDEVVMQQAILGFAQLKLNKQFEGHTSLGKCRTWQNTQLKHDATYNRIFALTSAATAFDLITNKGDNRRALDEAIKAYKSDNSIVVVAVTLAQIQLANGHRTAGAKILQEFKRQRPEDARRSQLFIQVERTLGP